MPPRVVHKCTLISSVEDWLCSANADDVSSPNVRLRCLTGSCSHSTDSGPQCGAGHFPPTPPRRGIVDVPRVEDVDPTRKAECGDQLAVRTACATCRTKCRTAPRPPGYLGAEYQRLFSDALQCASRSSTGSTWATSSTSFPFSSTRTSQRSWRFRA